MKLLFTIIIALCGQLATAQTTLANGNSSVQLSGIVQMGYNQRFYDTTLVKDYKKNRFFLDDARIALSGKVRGKFEYELQVNLADFSKVVIDRGQSAPLINAFVDYTAIKNLSIKVGYQRIPFSAASLTPFYYSVWLQRPEIARGDFFARRDIGVVLKTTQFNQRLNVEAGAFSGMGEQSLWGDNDASGRLEYGGRIDYSYPSKFRYRDCDLNGTPVPMVRVGANARYANKRSATGPTYLMKTIDGEKLLYGADVAFQYQHFTAQAEFVQAKLSHRTLTSSEVQYNTPYTMAGGINAQLTYTVPSIKSCFAVRYDNFNPSDLIIGDLVSTASIGYAYFINDYRTVLRAHYFKRLNEATTFTGQGYTDDQVRFAIQFMF